MIAVSKRVLYIDNDHADQCLFKIFLSGRGVNVDACHAPTEAPILVRKNGYDAIFVDYRLPILNGVQLIKKFMVDAHCPVYIVSAHDRNYIEKEISREGVEVAGFISKDGFRHNLEAVMDVLYGPA